MLLARVRVSVVKAWIEGNSIFLLATVSFNGALSLYVVPILQYFSCCTLLSVKLSWLHPIKMQFCYELWYNIVLLWGREREWTLAEWMLLTWFLVEFFQNEADENYFFSFTRIYHGSQFFPNSFFHSATSPRPIWHPSMLTKKPKRGNKGETLHTIYVQHWLR